MCIVIGEQYKFNYPVEFTTLHNYTVHRGHTLRVIRQLTEEEADQEGLEPMFEVVAEDGWVACAWESELEEAAK